MAEYRTRDGDMLDRICWLHYGFSSGTVEAVLAANPWLADEPPVLTGGKLITLPVVPWPGLDDLVHLWD